MPRIIQDNKQIQALESIQTDLESIRQIDRLMDGMTGGKGTSALTLTCKPASGRAISVPVDPKFQRKALAAVTAQRQALAAAVTANAKKYHIELDDDETALVRPTTSSDPGPEAEEPTLSTNTPQ